MPVIKGVCVPTICFKALFNTAAARLSAIKQDGTPVNDPVKLQALQMFYGQAYDDALAKFNNPNPVLVSCDGCRCAYTNPNPPVTPLTVEEETGREGAEATLTAAGHRAR